MMNQFEVLFIFTVLLISANLEVNSYHNSLLRRARIINLKSSKDSQQPIERVSAFALLK